MNTTISLSLPVRDAQRSRKLAVKRGFDSLSAYLRFLLAQDDVEVISNEELVRLSKETDVLYKQGKLIKANSVMDLLK